MVLSCFLVVVSLSSVFFFFFRLCLGRSWVSSLVEFSDLLVFLVYSAFWWVLVLLVADSKIRFALSQGL